MPKSKKFGIEMFSDYKKRSYCYVCVIHVCDTLTTVFEKMFKRSCYLSKILWSWARPQQIRFSQIHLNCAVMANLPLLNPKLGLKLPAALSTLQRVLPHPPWRLHDQEQAAWLLSWVSAFYFSLSLVRNNVNAKEALAFFCSLTVVAVHLSVHAGRQDVGSPFYLVPCKGHALCGLCGPVDTSMTSPVGLDTPYENLSGHWYVLLAFIPGIFWFQLKKCPWCI